MRKLLKLAAIATLAAVPVATSVLAQSKATEATPYEAQKVVYHINYPGGEAGEAYRGALNNLSNHIDAVGKDNLDLRVVLHGNGVELLQHAVDNQQLQGRLADLKNKGVRFVVCNNTLTGRDIDPKDLFDVWPEDIVPSGVAELAKLQMEGFSYIKP